VSGKRSFWLRGSSSLCQGGGINRFITRFEENCSRGSKGEGVVAIVYPWPQLCEVHNCGKQRVPIGNGKFIYVCRQCQEEMTKMPPPDGYD